MHCAKRFGKKCWLMNESFSLAKDLADPYGGAYKVTAGLSTEFGTERVIQTPISEEGFVGATVGARADRHAAGR